MKGYIERAAVHELVKRIPKYEMFNYDRTTALLGIDPDDVDSGVDKIPAADVAPVRHGRWTDAESDDGGTLWHCSMCSYPVKTIGGYPIYKYCPMCGARMDKEDEHEAD